MKRKQLTRTLAVLFLFGMFVTSAFAAQSIAFSDDNAIAHKEAVYGCVELGIIKGHSDGSFDPAADVTRAEMAKMIAVTQSGGREPYVFGLKAPSYNDTKNHWAKDSILFCSSTGIVSGMGDGSFALDQEVTALQAAKMLLVTLGYDAEIESFTGTDWAEKIDARAIENGLYVNLSEALQKDAPLSRDSAAQMIWNALGQKTIMYENGKEPVQTQKTLKEKHFTAYTYQIGETYKTNDFALTVQSAKTVSEYAGKTAPEGQTYAVIRVHIENIRGKNIVTGAVDFELLLGDTIIEAEEPWADSMLYMVGIMNPFGSYKERTADIVYTVPKGTTQANLSHYLSDEHHHNLDTYIVTCPFK